VNLFGYLRDDLGHFKLVPVVVTGLTPIVLALFAVMFYMGWLGDDGDESDKVVDPSFLGHWVIDKVPDLPEISFEPGDPWWSKILQVTSGSGDEDEYGIGEDGDNGQRGQVLIDRTRVHRGTEGRRWVQARLINRGKAPLLAAWVDILFLDANDHIILRRPVNPLVVSGGVFGDKSVALETGKTRFFRVETDGVPASWVNRVKVLVVGSEFAP